MMQTDQLVVFLCHASEDKAAVRMLRDRLRSEGFEPWLDEEKILPGQDWHLEIQKAVRTAHVVLVALSLHSTTKAGYVQRELRYALDVADEQPEGSIFLVPAKLSECTVPERLRRWQWVDLTNDNGYDALVKALHKRAADLGMSVFDGAEQEQNKVTKEGTQSIREVGVEPLYVSENKRLLEPDQCLVGEFSRTLFRVVDFLGQMRGAELYLVGSPAGDHVLRWYFPSDANRFLEEHIRALIRLGSPGERFIWPTDILRREGDSAFGYVVAERETRFVGIPDLLRGRYVLDSAVISTAGFRLADSFERVHAKGLCFGDISFDTFLVDPNTGEVRICDTADLHFQSESPPDILGTPRFLAPEIILGQSRPSRKTDLYSLAVLLFYLFVFHHPLEGKKETEIRKFDLPAMQELYAVNPVFIFDPEDESNRPSKGYHDHVPHLWHALPQFIQDLFVRAFTQGLHEPRSRITESEWCNAFIRMRDTI